MYKVEKFSRYYCDYQGVIYSTNYKKTGRTQALKPAISTDGYLKTVLLDDDGKYHTIAVHRFVAEAFFGKKLPGQEVNHKNGVKTDNCLNNLEYCTRRQNVQHAFDTGLAKGMSGEKNHNAILTKEAVFHIREVAANGGRFYGRKELAEKYGVTEGHIKTIVNRKKGAWKHLSGLTT